LEKGAEIDVFGVGTKLGTSADRPYVDIIYKLCERMTSDGKFKPIMKLSEGKATLPGRKQVFRVKDANGYFVKDIIALEDEEIDGEPLLVKVVDRGKIIYNFPSLEKIRERALDNLSRLHEKYKRLKNPAKYPVKLSPNLSKLINELEQKLR
ncbi:MAG: nicotinate phosphoribosyltransferase, partial [Candidatus Bathyarchaeia archaeon]